MNHEEYLKKNLLDCMNGDHPLSKSITIDIVARTMSLYKDQAFECLDLLIKKSMDEIKFKSKQIECLSKPGGITASDYAEHTGWCVQTARKQLNGSVFAACNAEKRPYIYTLKESK